MTKWEKIEALITLKYFGPMTWKQLAHSFGCSYHSKGRFTPGELKANLEPYIESGATTGLSRAWNEFSNV